MGEASTQGYINLFWLREFLDLAVEAFQIWFQAAQPNSNFDWEQEALEVFNLENASSLNLFLNRGILPALSQYSASQQHLIQAAFAYAVLKSDARLWDECGNLREHMLGSDMRITEAPNTVFRDLYDCAFPDSDGLSAILDLPVTFNTADSLALYKYSL